MLKTTTTPVTENEAQEHAQKRLDAAARRVKHAATLQSLLKAKSDLAVAIGRWESVHGRRVSADASDLLKAQTVRHD